MRISYLLADFLGKKSVFAAKTIRITTEKQPTNGLLHSAWRKHQCLWKCNCLKALQENQL